MSYASIKAKLNIPPNKTVIVKTRNCQIVSNEYKTIATSEETTLGGTLHLTKEQYEKGMALSRKMKNMSAW